MKSKRVFGFVHKVLYLGLRDHLAGRVYGGSINHRKLPKEIIVLSLLVRYLQKPKPKLF
jgi:hypothetical protein